MMKFVDLLRRRESWIRGEVCSHDGVDDPREGETVLGKILRLCSGAVGHRILMFCIFTAIVLPG